MLRKKSIVLSDTENNSNKKAVLSLEEDGIGIRGTLRLYNFTRELPGISSLGFYVNQKVYKAGLTLKANMLYEFFIDLKNIPQKFSCAVVNFQNANATPILYGANEGSDDDIYGSIISEITQDKSIKNTEKVLDKFGVGYEDEEAKQIEEDIDNALCNNNCSECIYKKYFFENIQKGNLKNSIEIEKKSSNEEELKTEPKEQFETSELFFDKLKPQIDKLFAEHPVDEHLQKLFPSSKWVKVEYEDDGDFYVFGLLYDEEENIKYVCYGVPAVFEEEPPKELSGFPIWLPLNQEKQDGFGYWMTYQDASTGEPVKAIIE